MGGYPNLAIYAWGCCWKYPPLPCTGGIFRGECVSRETWYGGHIKINLVIYGEAVYLWGGGWVRR